jgi:hypothetical protein
MEAAQSDIRAIQDHGVYYVFSRCLHCIVELGVADHLGETPEPPEQIAAKVGAHPDALARVLRYLASGGIFENLGGHFGHSPQSRLLRADHPQSQRAWTLLVGSDLSWDSFRALGYSLRSGRPVTETMAPGGFFAYFAARPREAAVFDEGMASKSRADIASVLRAYDFSSCRQIADIGGGRGHLLEAVLESAPGATGMLFDLPQVIEQAAGRRSDRLSLCSGDFFRDRLPTCDTYLLMNVVHDWADTEASAILRAVRKSIPTGGRVLVLETLLPQDPGDRSIRAMLNLQMDIAMLSLTGGRERTRAEYERLLMGSGFRLNRVIETHSGLAILEAVTAEG